MSAHNIDHSAPHQTNSVKDCKRFSYCYMLFCSVVCSLALDAACYKRCLSVCLSDCRLSHSCILLKPFDEFRCRLAGTLVGFNDTIFDEGPRFLQVEGEIWRHFSDKRIQVQIVAITWQIQMKYWVDV